MKGLKRKTNTSERDQFAHKIICLVNVLQPVEFLHSLLPFAFCIIVPVKNSHHNQSFGVPFDLQTRNVKPLRAGKKKKRKKKGNLNELPNELISGATKPLSVTTSFDSYKCLFSSTCDITAQNYDIKTNAANIERVLKNMSKAKKKRAWKVVIPSSGFSTRIVISASKTEAI